MQTQLSAFQKSQFKVLKKFPGLSLSLCAWNVTRCDESPFLIDVRAGRNNEGTSLLKLRRNIFNLVSPLLLLTLLQKVLREIRVPACIRARGCYTNTRIHTHTHTRERAHAKNKITRSVQLCPERFLVRAFCRPAKLCRRINYNCATFNPHE